jgi:hypothetical protein
VAGNVRGVYISLSFSVGGCLSCVVQEPFW